MSNNLQRGRPVMPPSLLDQLAAARRKAQAEHAEEVGNKARTDPTRDPNSFPSLKPPGVAIPTPRTPGIYGIAKNLDRSVTGIPNLSPPGARVHEADKNESSE